MMLGLRVDLAPWNRPPSLAHGGSTTYRVAVTPEPAGTQWMARSENEIPPTDDWLTNEEAARLADLRFTKRRTEYLLRRWVCKHAVATAFGLPIDPPSLARVEVANRTSGAPYVEVDGLAVEIDVSITDRAGWAVCLVGAASRVGCDLELVEPRSAAFVADFLTADEQAFVASRQGDDRHAAANLIWSAKESALKVLQTGLRRDTRSVEVTVSPVGTVSAGEAEGGWHRLEVRTAEGLLLPGWWRRDGVFLVTVASEQPLEPPRALAGSGDLTTAQPVHSWLDGPLSQ